jgi:hypothetical protein
MLRAAPGFVACAFLSSAPVGLSPDRDASRLRPGLFLYAAPDLADPRFAEAVVLLIEHGPDGSMGLVVNRPTEVPLRRALDQADEPRGGVPPLYWGGPVQPEAIRRRFRVLPGTRRSVAEGPLHPGSRGGSRSPAGAGR